MYQIRNLSNGIRVISEKIGHVRSISIGVWVGNGSRYENKAVGGISHYIEHMLFKGTSKRSAYKIAWDLDSVGGVINAFTGREETCFYTQTLDTHANLAIDILSDMLQNSLMSDELINLERQVILEEMNMYNDDPEEVVHDLIMEACWGDSALGKPVLGTSATLENINSDIMHKYLHEHYTTGNIVIAVSGNFDDGLFDELEKKFGNGNFMHGKVDMPKAEYHANTIVQTRDIGQVQIIAGFKGLDTHSDDIYSMLAVNNIFGNGMSSRLFQNIREKTGLVYSVYSNGLTYTGTGMFGISAGTSADNLEQVCRMITDEVKTLKRDKLTKNELDMVKEQLKGTYILSRESTGARMQSAGRNLLLGKKLYTEDEVLARIDNISLQSTADVIDKVFDTSTLSVAAVGAIDSADNLFDF